MCIRDRRQGIHRVNKRNHGVVDTREDAYPVGMCAEQHMVVANRIDVQPQGLFAVHWCVADDERRAGFDLQGAAEAFHIASVVALRTIRPVQAVVDQFKNCLLYTSRCV